MTLTCSDSMLKITHKNYEVYNETFETIWKYSAPVMNIDLDSSSSPVNVARSWENHNRTLAKRGLKEGLRDALTMVLLLPEGVRSEINHELIQKGLPGLYKLLSVIRDIPRKVLKAGIIKNLDEFYIIKEFLLDIDSDVAIDDRNRLEVILSDFESIYGNSGNAQL